MKIYIDSNYKCYVSDSTIYKTHQFNERGDSDKW